MFVLTEILTYLRRRIAAALPAAVVHLVVSVLVALAAASLVWLVWYPGAFAEIAGGRQLFLLVVVVDVVCGPLLTLVIYSKSKPAAELIRDLGLVALIQIFALVYGLHAMYVARPLYLVHEIERFRVIAQPDFLGELVDEEIANLRPELRPGFWSGPRLVGTRSAKDPVEYSEVLMASLAGGRDFAQRPDFYVPYDKDYREKVLKRAKSLDSFLKRNPVAILKMMSILDKGQLNLGNAYVVPLAHAVDWVVVIDSNASVVGFAPGDGFTEP